ncbi:AraC family transcriptional regulator [Acidisoma cladoniae]|jgi:AraC family transcriptional regulator|uniref:AraC family transcriptional regulator n=1 Tax=Acidisoma cladoniae TaxID=3040935 RepID=UPI002551BA96|nr:AraC family transcriptional regulator [Acidisoma sp. PAMC 29798]
MTRSLAYGRSLASRFRIETAPVVVSKTLQKTEVAFTRVQLNVADPQLTLPIPQEDAYLIGVQLRAVPMHDLWLDGRMVSPAPFLAGSTVFYDLKKSPTARCLSPFDTLFFYFPRRVFDLIADQAEVPRFDDLNYVLGEAIADRTIHSLALSLLPALDRSGEMNRLYFEHVALAAGTHLAQTYGGMAHRRSRVGLLATWQERRAKALIAANLHGDLSRSQLAAECGLSPDYFARAFKRSTGVSPHQWLLMKRVELTKELLRSSNKTLAEVAIAAGFYDQSHMTRVFSNATGTTPASWRRAFYTGASRHAPERGTDAED